MKRIEGWLTDYEPTSHGNPVVWQSAVSGFISSLTSLIREMPATGGHSGQFRIVDLMLFLGAPSTRVPSIGASAGSYASRAVPMRSCAEDDASNRRRRPAVRRAYWRGRMAGIFYRQKLLDDDPSGITIRHHNQPYVRIDADKPLACRPLSNRRCRRAAARMRFGSAGMLAETAAPYACAIASCCGTVTGTWRCRRGS
jgi:hypothetical protein